MCPGHGKENKAIKTLKLTVKLMINFSPNHLEEGKNCASSLRGTVIRNSTKKHNLHYFLLPISLEETKCNINIIAFIVLIFLYLTKVRENPVLYVMSSKKFTFYFKSLKMLQTANIETFKR